MTALAMAAARACLRRFGRAQGGQVAVMFAVSALTLVTAVGGGIDLSRAFVARQQLFHAATLTCQYSARPQVVAVAYQNGSSQATYIAQVDSAAANFVSAQSSTLTQTNSAPFSYVRGGASSVQMAAAVPTYFMGLAGVRTMPVSTLVSCANGAAQADDTQPSILVKESFEYSACTGNCWSAFAPSGRSSVDGYAPTPTPTNTPPTNYGYTGQSGNQWTITGYCLEVDGVGRIKSTVADGSYSAELDCDNGSGSAGNSSISTRTYMSVGTYELRYNYSGRVGYNNYSPAVICGSAATDVAWANDTNSARGTALRTNQINVYLDQDATGSPPPTHTTLDGSQTLAGANLIDECVYSDNWIERSVKITVTTAGYYWLSFAADGANDSYGGQIDNIRLCRNTCSGTVADNFPPAWKTSPVLFEDTFENPTYSTDPYASTAHAKGGNLAVSYGTSGTASSGWPLQPQSGWAVAPYNEVWFWMQGATQGSQYFSLQGWNGFSNPSDPLNRSISRPFILNPGYYSFSYDYTSLMDFGYDFVYSNGYYPICWQNTSYNYTMDSTYYGMKRGRYYPNTSGAVYSQYLSTNFMQVFLAHGALVSTPNGSSTLGGAPTYTNPDNTVTSTPTTPLDNGSNFATNSPANPNAVIDQCFYSGGWAWVPRTINVKITKPGIYWLAFSALGDPVTTSGAGPAVDDVKVTALNSPYGAAPATPSTIPAPGPAPGSTISYTGFSIVADPFAP